MRSAVGAALCAVRMQDVFKVDACIHASVFVHVLHVSHGAGSFGSSPSLHLHAPHLPVVLLTFIVVAVYIARLKLYGKEAAWADGMCNAVRRLMEEGRMWLPRGKAYWMGPTPGRKAWGPAACCTDMLVHTYPAMMTCDLHCLR